MRQVKVECLTHEAFGPLRSVLHLHAPKCYALQLTPNWELNLPIVYDWEFVENGRAAEGCGKSGCLRHCLLPGNQ